jgi:hypothetical protein
MFFLRPQFHGNKKGHEATTAAVIELGPETDTCGVHNKTDYFELNRRAARRKNYAEWLIANRCGTPQEVVISGFRREAYDLPGPSDPCPQDPGPFRSIGRVVVEASSWATIELRSRSEDDLRGVWYYRICFGNVVVDPRVRFDPP